MYADFVLDHQSILNEYYKAGYIADNEMDDLLNAILTKNIFMNDLNKLELRCSTSVNGRTLVYTYFDSRKYGILTYNICITVTDDKGMIDFLVYYDTENNRFIEEQ
jgi:hypothetical protein